ncbi:MAG: hypothetical protein ACE5LL_05490 [Alphaproteobacteria bacterium]
MTERSSLHPEVARQLAALALHPPRPLVISDADEVLVGFFASFESYLVDNGLYFTWESYRLAGNIRCLADDVALVQEEIRALVEAFFAGHIERLVPIDGAQEALAALARRAHIVILSNSPLAQREPRRRSLARHGIDYPLVANIGSKAAAVRRLAEQVTGPVYFIDDSPQHHAEVAEAAGRVRRLHFVAEPRLAQLMGPARHSHRRVESWAAARAFIEEDLAAQGF